MKKNILTITFVFLMMLGSAPAFSASVGDIPIQHHGRIKPFSAFAQETLQFISGKTSWHGKGATGLFFATLDHPELFLELPFIRVDHPELRKTLGLQEEGNTASFRQLKSSFHTLGSLVQSSEEKRNKDVRPSLLEQQAETLYQRVMTVQNLNSGELLTVIPAQGAWTSPYKTAGAESNTFKQLVNDYTAGSSAVAQGIEQWLAKVDPLLEKGMPFRLKLESIYYAFQPFYYAWIFYLLGFVCLLLPKPAVRDFGKFLVLAGFVAHTTGLLLRWLILLRPPVANMYETMVFMDWVLMLSVGVFVVLKKRQAFLSSGALVSALVMLYAKLLPVDQSLDVLAPVLRSSYWLTVHVITIISSYSLFAFAMAVAHRQLFLSVLGKQNVQEEQVSANTIYRLLQAGLIALGAGTILGGVWANEAWGRFWGWDPKETWAFITFLGYMAILHLRYRKQLSNFGLAVGGILGFLFVIMTWYGVNFVLGRGLHSYGSGSGGLKWIIYFLIAEVCFLGFISFKKSKRR